MASLLTWMGTSLSVAIHVFAMMVVTFVSVYLVTETYEEEMAEDVAQEEGIPAAGGWRSWCPGLEDRSLWCR